MISALGGGRPKWGGKQRQVAAAGDRRARLFASYRVGVQCGPCDAHGSRLRPLLLRVPIDLPALTQ